MGKSVTLGGLQSVVDVLIDKSETDLAGVLDNIKTGKEVSAAQLLYYTEAVNQNSLTVSLISSIVKERADTLKGCCQKF